MQIPPNSALNRCKTHQNQPPFGAIIRCNELVSFAVAPYHPLLLLCAGCRTVAVERVLERTDPLLPLRAG